MPSVHPAPSGPAPAGSAPAGSAPVDIVEFACPRCQRHVSERFYGPCAPCRDELRAGLSGAALSGTALSGTGGIDDGEPEKAACTEPPQRVRFEPKMNVVPNHVATKDD